MEEINPIFYICLFSNVFMFGVILFVQIVHYPIFLQISFQNLKEDWNRFHHFHSSRTGWVVGIPMGLQLVSTMFLENASFLLYVFTALSLGTTAFFSMPLHQKLSQEFSAQQIQKLIFTNWLRVVGWGGASVVLARALILK